MKTVFTEIYWYSTFGVLNFHSKKALTKSNFKQISTILVPMVLCLKEHVFAQNTCAISIRNILAITRGKVKVKNAIKENTLKENYV